MCMVGVSVVAKGTSQLRTCPSAEPPVLDDKLAR